MPTNDKPMTGLLSRLGSAGIPSMFARKVLPPWWEDEVAAEPAGLQQAQLYFARAFNLDLQSLAACEPVPQFRSSVRKFKLSKNVSEAVVSTSAHYATGIAKLAMHANGRAQGEVPRDPASLREAILRTHGCVNLPALLEWCANATIPVLHIEKVPGKKMTGLVVREGGRYAIVLSKMGHPAHLLFHLAHELGHIAHAHLADDGFVADETIGKDGGDADEKEADAYAIRLLNGAEVRYRAGGVIKSGKALHTAAVAKGQERSIDPGHIIANFGHNQQMYAIAAIALKYLGGPNRGCDMVNQVFFSRLDDSALSDDQLVLLKVATGYSA